MTTLAIIGAGIAGRSLLWALAKENKNYSKIVIFNAESFLPACSLSSTATVALRGVTPGHSDLGDTLYESFHHFKKHFHENRPSGVHSIRQFSATSSDFDKFHARFPEAQSANEFLGIKFKTSVQLFEEESFLVEPEVYMSWLLENSKVDFQMIQALIKTVTKTDNKYELIDSNGQGYVFDKVVYTAGAYQKAFDSELKTKVVQGSYFELSHDFGKTSFSLTLDGCNLVYHSHSKTVLIGSTSIECNHLLCPEEELLQIYKKLESLIETKLPAVDFNKVKVGLREKAPKRSPYLIQKENEFFLGGFYKNGFSLGPYMAQKLIKKI